MKLGKEGKGRQTDIDLVFQTFMQIIISKSLQLVNNDKNRAIITVKLQSKTITKQTVVVTNSKEYLADLIAPIAYNNNKISSSDFITNIVYYYIYMSNKAKLIYFLIKYCCIKQHAWLYQRLCLVFYFSVRDFLYIFNSSVCLQDQFY